MYDSMAIMNKQINISTRKQKLLKTTNVEKYKTEMKKEERNEVQQHFPDDRSKNQ